ncbi:MAG: uroporphyrinogen-III synthase [Hyphomonadaceae bacterium]|nr:uroporphyrinogen-III synthase [Hyphomonadaceae bacterium]
MRMLVTRASPGAEATAKRIRAQGGEPVLAPLLKVEKRRASVNLAAVQALLFTSTNGVQSFAEQSKERALPALCVGDATAHAARLHGFTDVRAGGGDVAALAKTIIATLDPAKGALVHAAGKDVAGDLPGALAPHRFVLEHRIFYEAVAAHRLPAEALARLRQAPPDLDIVLFHSPRAAHIFRQLAPHAPAMLAAACLSEAVAFAATVAGRWREVIVAETPTDAALLTAAFGSGDRPPPGRP